MVALRDKKGEDKVAEMEAELSITFFADGNP